MDIIITPPQESFTQIIRKAFLPCIHKAKFREKPSLEETENNPLPSIKKPLTPIRILGYNGKISVIPLPVG